MTRRGEPVDSSCGPRPRKRGGCDAPVAPPSLESFDDVVEAYIHDVRPRSRAELRYFASRPSLAETIRLAALGKGADGKRASHYRRRKAEALEVFRHELQVLEDAIASCESFERLHRLVERVGRPIPDIGTLTIYDAAQRIGARLGLEPDRVYLHAGAREGAKRLGLDGRRETVEIDELPAAFKRLEPYEIEDCLCIYRDDLARIQVKSSFGSFERLSPEKNSHRERP